MTRRRGPESSTVARGAALAFSEADIVMTASAVCIPGGCDGLADRKGSIR